jgi:thioredoxin reductase (NADPH)
MENVLILGTGCAGLTAAIYSARANLSPLVIEGIQPGGQLTTTSEVENFPGFPEGVDGFELMDRLRKQAAKFGTRFQSDLIEHVDFSGPVKVLRSSTRTYEAKAVIIATGASPRLIGVPGEKEMFGGKGVTTCATCDGAFYRKMDVAVVGGGDSACEEALFLTRFCAKIYLIHRRNELRASDIMAKRTLAHANIVPVWDTVIERVLADEKGHVRGLALQNLKTSAKSELAVKGVFVAIGHLPNTQPFKGVLPLDDLGYFITETGSQVRTNVPGIYVAGDCADHAYRQAITAAGMGCQAAIETERWLAEHEE